MTKEGTPAVLFRNSIDLNRFSNGVSRKIVQSNIDVIIRAAKQLSKIDPSRPPSYKTARLRSLIKQTKESLSTWEKESVDVMIRELEGLAGVQAGFVEDQIAQALPNGVLKTDLNPLGYSVQTVAVSPSFAKAVVTKDPSVLSLKSTGTFDLTAAQGAEVLLPNGETVQKAFRGLASRQATQFNQVVRTGLLSGETTESIVSQLIGKLQFGQGAKTNQQYLLAGKEVLNMASHQIRTVVRTSINQVSNAASQQVYKANEDITEKYKYVSTLDSKTTALCASLDGKEFEYGKGPEPPQHFNCRSTTVAVIDYDALKKRGFDFDVPKEGRRAAAGGMVPANETYGKWLYGQRKAGTKFTPGVRQIEALGKEKAKYFNRLANKYGADDAIKKFVREDGSEVSLFQLKKRYGKPESITVKKKTAPKVLTKKEQPKVVKTKVQAPVASDFVSSKPLKKLNVEETIKSYEDYKKYRIKMSEIQYGKDYDHWTGDIDARLERLRQGLDLNTKDWPTSLDYLYWRQGFTKKPIRVKNVKALKARKDLYQGADGENLLVYRGVSNDKWSDQFKGKGSQGDLYFAGEGIYGNGSYAASRSIHSTKATLAKGNQNALTLAKNYTEPYGSKITEAQKEIRTTAFGIKKGANIKTWKKGVSTKKLNTKEPHAFPDSDWYEKEFKQWQKDIKKEAEELTGLTYDSTGEAATALGIDAYQIPLPLLDEIKETGELVHYNLDYWVILNRNAIVVSDTVGL